MQKLLVVLCVFLLVLNVVLATDSTSNVKENVGKSEEQTGKEGFLPALFNSFTMTIATELGDKTFCIAAVLAMKYNRMYVLIGATGALLIMTVLSVGAGLIAPTLLSKEYTHYLAALLFGYFGVRLLLEARSMDPNGGISDELKEVEEELGITNTPTPSKQEKSEDEVSDLESASSAGTPAASTALAAGAGGATPVLRFTSTSAVNNNSSSPGASLTKEKTSQNGFFAWNKDWAVLSQAFTLTFLAEWGDRSQIATIAMTAAQSGYFGYFGVLFGGFVGHSLCTGLAVIGGRLLASRISERTVAIGGGLLFLLFCIHGLWAGPDRS
jgi:Ca2+/H+ antiporter, TMEM165/GDT1 family